MKNKQKNMMNVTLNVTLKVKGSWDESRWYETSGGRTGSTCTPAPARRFSSKKSTIFDFHQFSWHFQSFSINFHDMFMTFLLLLKMRFMFFRGLAKALPTRWLPDHGALADCWLVAHVQEPWRESASSGLRRAKHVPAKRWDENSWELCLLLNHSEV